MRQATSRLPARGAVAVPPDLVIEVISPSPEDSRRDRVDKADDYARCGVRWCWLVDPDARTLEVEREAGAAWNRAEPALWAEVDELAIDPA